MGNLVVGFLFAQILGRLDEIVASLRQQKEEIQMTLAELGNHVKSNTNAINSAVETYKTLAAEFAAHKDDPEEVQRLADELDAGARKLASEVVANTPSAATTP